MQKALQIENAEIMRQEWEAKEAGERALSHCGGSDRVLPNQTQADSRLGH